MDGMADYVRTPSRIFPDATDFDMAAGFLNSEKARSLGLHHLLPHQQQHPFAAGAPHANNSRLPPMPLATIQQHLFALQQRTSTFPPMSHPTSGGAPAGSNQALLPFPFPHGFLSQWTLAAAAGFGLNQLGLFGLAGLPPGLSGSLGGSAAAGSPPQSSQLSPQASSAAMSVIDNLPAGSLKASSSPNRHRFSPYPSAIPSKLGTNETASYSIERPASAKSVLDVSK